MFEDKVLLITGGTGSFGRVSLSDAFPASLSAVFLKLP